MRIIKYEKSFNGYVKYGKYHKTTMLLYIDVKCEIIFNKIKKMTHVD